MGFTGDKKQMDIKDTMWSLFKPLALGTYRALSLSLHDLTFDCLYS